MKFNKKSIITSIAAAAMLTAAPFGLNAKAESNTTADPTCNFGTKVTIQNQEDVKAFLDKYMKELEQKYGVKVQLNQFNQAPAAEKQAETTAPKQEEKKPAEKVEAPAPQQPAQNKTAEQPAQKETKKAASEVSEFEKKVVELTNAERAKQGLSPLQLDENLSKVAREKSKDMKANNYFSHNSPTYGSPFDMMKQFGIQYRTAGENIAMGQRSPEEVVNAWMNSEGHRANIMNGNFTHIGVGHVAEGNYWTQMFIGK